MNEYLVITQKKTLDTPGLHFSIDRPINEQLNSSDGAFLITVSGWAFANAKESIRFVFDFDIETSYAIDQVRPDVQKAYKEAPLTCGFHRTITVRKSFQVGFFYLGKIYWIASIQIEKIKVLKGKDGHLFLDSDTNRIKGSYSFLNMHIYINSLFGIEIKVRWLLIF